MGRLKGSQRLDSPRKNRLVGAWEVHGNIRCAARDHDVKYRTAHNIIRKYQDSGSTTNKPRPGCPPIFSAPEKAQIVDLAVRNRRKPFRDIGNEITPAVSSSTVARVVAEEGYGRRVARKVQFLTEVTKGKRYSWACDQRSRRDVDWCLIGW